MQAPARVLLAASFLAAAFAASKVRQGRKSGKRDRSQKQDVVTPKAKEVVHVYGTVSPSLSGTQQLVTQDSVQSATAAVALLLTSTVLVCCPIAAAAVRGHWDLAVSVAVAWLLIILGQLVYGPHQFAMQPTNKTVSEADATVVVMEEDFTPTKLQDLAGTWIKDNAASDSLDPAMDLLHMGGLVRTAAKLMKGVKISLDDDEFSFCAFSVISWFKITESYQLNGKVSHVRRRDLRRGNMHGSVQVTPWGTLKLTYDWKMPYEGRGSDEFFIDSEGRLNVVTTVTVEGRSAGYTLRYNRK